MLPKCKNRGELFLSVSCVPNSAGTVYGLFCLHAEEEEQVRRAILSCSLTEEKEGYEEEGESDEDEGCD